MIQLKDMNEILSIKQPIRLVYPTGESNIANIRNFENWKDCVVENVYSKNGELVIVLRTPEYYELIPQKFGELLDYFFTNHPRQMAEMYSKDNCIDDIADIYAYFGFSDDVLDRYRM